VTEILLARHGETEWNVERRWQGHADVPLNALGRDQAHDLAARLAGEHVDAIYASDLSRARETAEIVGAALGVAVRTLRELREIDVGSWSGRTTDEIQREDPGARDRVRDHGYGWEGGETPAQMAARVVAAVRRLAAEHPDERILIVAHGGVIRALGAAAAGIDYAEYRRRVPVVANCEVSALTCLDGVLHVRDASSAAPRHQDR
jgi:broad specificity phosphatase PhoE